MIKFRLFTGLVTIIIIYALSACKHEPTLSADTPTVCFQQQVYPLIKSNCAVSGCHAAASSEEGPVLETYDNIRSQVVPYKPNKSRIYKAITANKNSENFMPPSPRTPLTIEQINLISVWILQGAPNNVCAEPPCDTTNVTFSGSIWPLLSTWCTGCHSGANAESGIHLENYNQIAMYASDTTLYWAVTGANGLTPMPYQSDPLSDCSIAMIRIWIENGYPND